MNREIKNNGDYLEVDADKLLENVDAAKKAKILVITKVRIELSGADKAAFLKKYENASHSLTPMNDPALTSEQRSDNIIRSLVCD
jgi:hypothetical protein